MKHIAILLALFAAPVALAEQDPKEKPCCGIQNPMQDEPEVTQPAMEQDPKEKPCCTVSEPPEVQDPKEKPCCGVAPKA